MIIENPFIVVLILLCICLIGYIGIHRGREIICKDKCSRDDEQCKTVMAKDFVYMAAIFSIVVVIAVSFAMYHDDTAVAYFAFAGTVTSIILSVIAIIMTIDSERKSDVAKAQLDGALKTMGEINEDLTRKIAQIKLYSDEIEQQLKEQKDSFRAIEQQTKISAENTYEIKSYMEKTIAGPISEIKGEQVQNYEESSAIETNETVNTILAHYQKGAKKYGEN